jgi:hypothetical protein
MNPFPVVDPIPLPAPVWLFKVLHTLTLALHFISVEMLLGGLAIALVLNATGRGKTPQSLLRLNASAAIARRLPILMTYVINLGVPPLLFAQVLYGRAIYTSSVLIGVYWIAVIFLLIGCYWHLYKFTGKVESGKSGWLMAAISLLLALAISKIYSTNMALMLRPEVWASMYAKSGLGVLLPPHDPTLMPRWTFMLIGGLAAGGLWMIWLAGRPAIDTGVREFLGTLGGLVAVVALAGQIALAFMVFGVQPAAVREGLVKNVYYHISMFVWLGGAVVLALVAAWRGFSRSLSAAPGWIVFLTGLVAMLGMVMVRDGIRDITLLNAGYNVWDRSVNANWSVVIIFLLTFVAGLACAGWLISVVLRAKPAVEKSV